MIEVHHHPKNNEHFARLLQFCMEIIEICEEVGIEPVLSGSLAVLGYTQNEDMTVNDVDLACLERDFHKIGRALDANRIANELKDWHVLQARRDDLKVEFDSIEFWMEGLPDQHDTLVVDGLRLKVVSLRSLKELYRRGLEDTAKRQDEISKAKYLALLGKFETLTAVAMR